jgi:hypothetical protein
MKSIWITSLEKDPDSAQRIIALLKKYGLQANGHFWNKDNRKMGWLEGKEPLLDPHTTMWVILGTAASFQDTDIRYGLSLLAMTIQAQKGPGLPVAILQTNGDLPTSADLPTALQHALVLSAANPAMPAKLVAKLHAKQPELPQTYHLDMVGNEQIGQWLEIHPTRDTWPGVLFGVDDGEISFQAVGPSGQLPNKTTLNYPMQGLKLEMGGTQFSAWAVRNPVSAQTAYFVKINGTPKTLLFGPYAEDTEADLYVVRLI